MNRPSLVYVHKRITGDKGRLTRIKNRQRFEFIFRDSRPANGRKEQYSQGLESCSGLYVISESLPTSYLSPYNSVTIVSLFYYSGFPFKGLRRRESKFLTLGPIHLSWKLNSFFRPPPSRFKPCRQTVGVVLWFMYSVNTVRTSVLPTVSWFVV